MNPKHNSVKHTLHMVINDIEYGSLDMTTLIIAIRQLTELLTNQINYALRQLANMPPEQAKLF